ncbi:MAG: hypothetical protein AAB331_03680 [Planctomycetota bacterium]
MLRRANLSRPAKPLGYRWILASLPGGSLSELADSLEMARE